jgi:hypothetical protein
MHKTGALGLPLFLDGPESSDCSTSAVIQSPLSTPLLTSGKRDWPSTGGTDGSTSNVCPKWDNEQHAISDLLEFLGDCVDYQENREGRNDDFIFEGQ